MQKVIIGLAPNITIEVSSENIKQIIEQASFWSSLPRECPICKAPLVFFHRLTREDDSYWGQACTGSPIHEANFGVYKKEERGFYYKGDWQKAYDAYQNSERGLGENDQPTYGNTPHPDAASAQREPFTGNPVAQTLGDMVTAKQLGMIRAIAREINMNPEDECKRVMTCDTSELSKRAASEFIEHLQGVQKAGFKVTVSTSVVQPAAPASAHPNGGLPDSGIDSTPAPVAATTAPAQHGPDCLCPQCEIPF